MNEGIFLVNMRLSFLYLIKHRPLLPLLIMSFLNCATIAFVGGSMKPTNDSAVACHLF